MVETMVRTVYGSSILPAVEREAARMKIAQLNACNACSTFRAPSMREAGVEEELYSHLDDYASYEGYTERQRLAIEYADRFATDHSSIDDDLFARLHTAFTDAEILDLTMCVAAYLGWAGPWPCSGSRSTSNSTSEHQASTGRRDQEPRTSGSTARLGVARPDPSRSTSSWDPKQPGPSPSVPSESGPCHTCYFRSQ